MPTFFTVYAEFFTVYKGHKRWKKHLVIDDLLNGQLFTVYPLLNILAVAKTLPIQFQSIKVGISTGIGNRNSWAHSEGHPHTEGPFTGTLVNVRDLRWNSGECQAGSREHTVVESPNFARLRQRSHEGARMLPVHLKTCLKLIRNLKSKLASIAIFYFRILKQFWPPPPPY